MSLHGIHHMAEVTTCSPLGVLWGQWTQGCHALLCSHIERAPLSLLIERSPRCCAESEEPSLCSNHLNPVFGPFWPRPTKWKSIRGHQRQGRIFIGALPVHMPSSLLIKPDSPSPFPVYHRYAQYALLPLGPYFAWMHHTLLHLEVGISLSAPPLSTLPLHELIRFCWVPLAKSLESSSFFILASAILWNTAPVTPLGFFTSFSTTTTRPHPPIFHTGELC